MQRGLDGDVAENLMAELDSSLIYGGAKRISSYEAELLDQIDESYDSHIKVQEELSQTKRDLQTAQKDLKRTDEAIGRYCSETTYKKILLERGWQFPKEEEEKLSSAPSDKELLEKLASSQRHDGELLEKSDKPTDAEKANITMKSVVSNAISSGITAEQVNEAERTEYTEQLKRDELGGRTKDD